MGVWFLQKSAQRVATGSIAVEVSPARGSPSPLSDPATVGDGGRRWSGLGCLRPRCGRNAVAFPRPTIRARTTHLYGSGSGSGRIHDSTIAICYAQKLFVLLLRPSGPTSCISLHTSLAFPSPSSWVSFSASHFQLQAPDRPDPHSTSLAPRQKKSQTTLLDFVPSSIRLTSPFPTIQLFFFINLPSAFAFKLCLASIPTLL